MPPCKGLTAKRSSCCRPNPQAQRAWTGEALPAITRLSGEAVAGETFSHGSLEFRGCVKVSISMQVRETAFFARQGEVPVRLERWFAPGVGMVREVRTVSEESKPNYVKTDAKLAQFDE